MAAFSAVALDGLPEIAAGADLAALLAEAAGATEALGGGFADGDVLVLAHKAVSKAEGAVRRLADVTPSPRAEVLARQVPGKDPRHVQVVLDESAELLRAERGVLISVTRHGFVCANAGVDASNAAAGSEGTVILLPRDPDASARALRARLRSLTGARIGVIVTDSFGRAWRNGQVDVAIGIAGVTADDDSARPHRQRRPRAARDLDRDRRRAGRRGRPRARQGLAPAGDRAARLRRARHRRRRLRRRRAAAPRRRGHVPALRAHAAADARRPRRPPHLGGRSRRRRRSARRFAITSTEQRRFAVGAHDVAAGHDAEGRALPALDGERVDEAAAAVEQRDPAGERAAALVRRIVAETVAVAFCSCVRIASGQPV